VKNLTETSPTPLFQGVVTCITVVVTEVTFVGGSVGRGQCREVLLDFGEPHHD